MIESWFNTPERIAALRLEAESWLGTPFFPNGNTKGMGVSCQKFVGEVHRAIGSADVKVPEVAMAHGRFSRGESLVEPFMDALAGFRRLICWSLDELQPGDMLGFRMGKAVHHMAIYMGSYPDGAQYVFIHAMEQIGTIKSSLSDATWLSRLGAVWRPVIKTI